MDNATTIILSTILALLLTQSAGCKALNVRLTLANPLNQALVQQPVTFGVPLPKNLGLFDTQLLGLVNADGQSIPGQFTVLARWGGAPDDPTAPVKWLLVDFQADAPASTSVEYFLRNYWPGPEPTPALALVNGAEAINIGTGAAQYSISKTDGCLSGPGLATPMYGRIVSGSTSYTSTGPVEVAVKQQGSMRCCIEVKGSYCDSYGLELLEYTSRYWFYAGHSFVRLFHTIENNNLDPLGEYEQLTTFNIGSANSVDIQDASFIVPGNLSGPLSYTAGGEAGAPSGSLSADLVLYQNSSGTGSWDRYPAMADYGSGPLDTSPRMQTHVQFKGYRLTLGEAQISQGDQAQGWLRLQGSEHSLGVGVRDFWQNFPKALRARTSGQMEIGLFPEEFGGSGYSFNLRAGEHKTHEMVLAYDVDSIPATLAPLRAVADSQWYIDSEAFGLTAGQDSEAWPDHEEYLAWQLDEAPDYPDFWDSHHSLLQAIENTDFYGIYDYGDWPIDYEGYGVAPLNCKYDMDQGCLLQWIRSGDERWLDLAEAMGRHTADIDIMHNLHTPRHWADGIAFGHSMHDESGFLNPHRNENSGSPDTAYGLAGMLLTYYLTGYEKALDSARELADCVEYRTRNDAYLCTYFPGDCSGEGYLLFDPHLKNDNTRPAANALSMMVKAAQAFGESQYIAAADALVSEFQAGAQPYIGGPTGSGDYIKPWMLGMFTKGLYEYRLMKEDFGQAEILSGDSITGFADFLHAYPWLSMPDIETGARACFPYEWYLDDRAGNQVEDVSNWLLLGADCMAAAYLVSGNGQYLTWGATLFRTGARDPFFEDDEALVYSQTKQTINSIGYGNLFLNAWNGE